MARQRSSADALQDQLAGDVATQGSNPTSAPGVGSGALSTSYYYL